MKNALSGTMAMAMLRRLSFTMPQGCILTIISVVGRAILSDCLTETEPLSRVTAMTAEEICFPLKTAAAKRMILPLSVTRTLCTTAAITTIPKQNSTTSRAVITIPSGVDS